MESAGKNVISVFPIRFRREHLTTYSLQHLNRTNNSIPLDNLKLLIVSHTEHYSTPDGQIVGLGPTVLEINYLSRLYEQVIHIGVFYKNQLPNAGYVPYKNSNIYFVPIPPYGGKNLLAKLRILWLVPRIIFLTLKELKKVDQFHFRAPTSMGVFLLPVLTFLTKKKGWYKYAGNWAQTNPPVSYAFQRWWLKHMQKRKVTINGRWKNLPSHCLPFENPCLENNDIENGIEVRKKKSYKLPLTICFVGRVESAKGINRLLEALAQYPHPENIKTLHVVGAGLEKKHFEQKALEIPVQIIFHGSLNREEVFQVYRKSHLIALPSDSEGFPKVLAEAVNFGCIPVASNLSSINQYITDRSGYLWNRDQETFADFFSRLNLENGKLSKKAKQTGNIAKYFTYPRYIERIKEEIIC